MSFWDDDIEFTDVYEEPGQNGIDQAVVNNSQTLVPGGGEQVGVQPTAGLASTEYRIAEKYRSAFSAARSPEEFDAQVEMFKAELNNKQQRQLKFGTPENETPLTGSVLFNSIMSGDFSVNSNLAKSFVDKVQYNFEMNIGPTSIARVPSELTDWEADNGFYLSPDEFGIDRKFKNDIMVSEDADKVSVLKSAFKNAIHSANSSVPGIGDGSEADSEYAQKVILTKGSYNSSLNVTGDLRDIKEVEKGPGTAINAAFSNAIYYDGRQKIPDGFRSIGAWKNPETQFYAEFFTDDKQIVVVFRGTDSIRTIFESDRQLLFGQVVAQFADVRDAKFKLEEIVLTNPELRGLPISATGHSLGGADAQYFTKLTGYPSETFGAPGIINSLKAMKDEDLAGVDKMPVINHINIYDSIGTEELGGHIGVVRKYDMHPDNAIPGWNDSALLEHSMDRYQSYLGYIPKF